MESIDDFSSQITFLNFQDYSLGRHFASEILGLRPVYDIGWAVVYAISGKAYLGVVDHSRSSLQSGKKDGLLISLTTTHIDEWYGRIRSCLGDAVSPIREVPDAGLKSFFFVGPEGYSFEIQQFLRPELRELF